MLAAIDDLPSRYGRAPAGPVETVGQQVYVLTVPSGRCKIGIARDPASRRAALQCGNPEKIDLLGASQLADGIGIDPREMERRLHQVLAARRVSGEWFDAPVERVLMAWKYVWLTFMRPAVVDRWHRAKMGARA